MCSNKGRHETKTALMSELFGECSYSDSVSNTEKLNAKSDSATKDKMQNDNEKFADARNMNVGLQVKIKYKLEAYRFLIYGQHSELFDVSYVKYLCACALLPLGRQLFGKVIPKGSRSSCNSSFINLLDDFFNFRNRRR